MMEMVTSPVMEEAVSEAISFVFSSRKERVSQKDLIERLEMAHINLDVALERSRMMPITIMSLLRLRKKLKDVFEECDDLLGKMRDREQVVPSLRRKIMHAVLPSFIIPNQDVLSSTVVGRFERHLLEGKDISYEVVRGSQTCSLCIWTASVEEYGRVAWLFFQYKDCKAPLKSFGLTLVLKLYESTNIIGIAVKCLQSLGPQFKSLAEVAVGELTQLPTQDVSYRYSVSWELVVELTTNWSPDPFCCIENGLNKPCANNIISSELTGRFPQEVMLVSFVRHFSADEKAWAPLKMAVTFAPHFSPILRDTNSLHQTEEGIQTKAIDHFICHPDMTKYDIFWDSAHGCAIFEVSKPITKTRRASKRSR